MRQQPPPITPLECTEPGSDYGTLLALVADPLGAYRIRTEVLERVLARTQGLTHGRRTPDPMLAAVEALRAEISAVLQARRRLDAEQAKQAVGGSSVRTSVPDPQGGTHVRAPVPPTRPTPPAGRRQPDEAHSTAMYADAL